MGRFSFFFSKKLRASISMLIACSMTILSLSVFVFIRGLELHLGELDLDRYITLLGMEQLSFYDRSLLDRYGVWGFASNVINLGEVSKAIRNRDNIVNANVAYCDLLHENDNFYNQAVRFSKYRISFELIEELKNRLKEFQQNSSFIDKENIDKLNKNLEKSLDKLGSREELLEKFKNKKKKPGSNNSDTSQDEESSDSDTTKFESLTKFDKEVKSLEEIPLEELAGRISKKKDSSIIPLLMKCLNEAIDLLDFELVEELGPLYFREYVMNVFSSQVRGPGAKTTSGKNFETITGQKMSSLKFQSPVEAERILLNLASDELAKSFMFTSVFSIRLLVHYCYRTSNETIIAVHTAEAASISAIIALISAGSVIIEIETLACILALISSAHKAWAEYKDLLNNKSVRLYPDANNSLYRIKSYYLDYLRIFSLLQSSQTQAREACGFVYSNSGGPFYESVSFLTQSKHFKRRLQYERTFSYDSSTIPKETNR